MPRPPTRVIFQSLALAVLTARMGFALPIPLLPDETRAAVTGDVGATPSKSSKGVAAETAAGATTPDASGSAAPTPDASGSVAPDGSGAPPDLLTATLPLDIATSSFYELVDWARSLGLSDSGSADDLRARLYDHYRVKEAPPATSGGRTVVIKTANQASYSGGSGDKGVVSLSGGVLLSIAEEGGSNYTISARTVIYDRGRNSVYAAGTVVYTRTTQGRTEEFRGSTLAADLDDWSGLFLDGVWRQQGASLGSSDRGLTFSSSSLERISGDYITLGDATVSSGQSDTPNFSIRAKRLWFVGESDWAALSALVYVGEVPVLWLPFFYYPSEEILFHPVFGFRTREGGFLQTTTWLLGQKPAAANNSAIIQFSQTSGPTEVRGIFLKHVPGGNSPGAGSAATPAGATGATAAGSGAATGALGGAGASAGTAVTSDSVKLLGDWYTGLGAFVGLDASFKPSGIVNRFDLTSGIGFSRSLFPGVSGLSSPFSSAGDWQSVWNNSNVFGLVLPFRFGGQLSLGLSAGPVRATLDLPVYSDTYFEQDFRNRSYDMDWLGMSNTTNALTTSTISVRSSLSQKLSLTGTIPVTATSPWLQNFGVTLNSSFNWLSKTDGDLSSSEPALYSYDPARNFFYPDSLRPVDLSLNLGGTLLNLSGSSTPAPAAAGATAASSAPSPATALPDLRSPWARDETSSATGKGGQMPAGQGGGASSSGDQVGSPSRPLADPDFPDPPAAPDPSLPTPPTPLSSKIAWTLQPGLVLERRFLSTAWNGASDINYSPLYDLASWKLAAGLASSIALYGTALTGSYNLSWAQQEQVRNMPDPNSFPSGSSTPGIITSTLLSDAQYANRKLSGSLTLTSQPLPASSLFSPSSVSWNFNSTLFSWSFDHFVNAADPSSAVYATHFPEWTSSAISANALGLTLAVKTGASQQSLTISATLPPLAESYSATLALAANPGGWALGLGSQARYVRQGGGSLKASPLSANAKLVAPFGLSLGDNATWDFDLGTLSSNSVNATWGWATASLQSQYTQPWSIDLINKVWKVSPDSSFIPSTFSASLSPRLDPDKSADWQPTLSGSLTYSQSLLRFTDSVMTVNGSIDLKLGSGFLLNFSGQSQNRNVWRYWPSLLGVPPTVMSINPPINPILDILRSLSVWDSSALSDGNFKLKSLSFKLSQDLDDWTLSASATATPTLSADSTYWYINPSFTLNIAWKDIPMMKSAITYQNSSLSW